MSQLHTAGGFSEFLTQIKANLSEEMAEYGNVDAVCFVLGTYYPRTKERAKEPFIITIGTPPEELGIEDVAGAIAEVAKSVTQQSQAVGYILVSEAWLSIQSLGSVKTAPSEDPNREEIVLLSGNHVSTGQFLCVAKINRSNGAPVLEQFENRDCWGKLFGRVVFDLPTTDFVSKSNSTN